MYKFSAKSSLGCSRVVFMKSFYFLHENMNTNKSEKELDYLFSSESEQRNIRIPRKALKWLE